VVQVVDCGCDRFRGVDCSVFAEEVRFSGCGVGCGHVIACDISLFSVRADLRLFMETSKQYLCIEG
jgi:sulfite reductase beta subunit-like hemoprotein